MINKCLREVRALNLAFRFQRQARLHTSYVMFWILWYKTCKSHVKCFSTLMLAELFIKLNSFRRQTFLIIKLTVRPAISALSKTLRWVSLTDKQFPWDGFDYTSHKDAQRYAVSCQTDPKLFQETALCTHRTPRKVLVTYTNDTALIGSYCPKL